MCVCVSVCGITTYTHGTKVVMYLDTYFETVHIKQVELIELNILKDLLTLTRRDLVIKLKQK